MLKQASKLIKGTRGQDYINSNPIHFNQQILSGMFDLSLPCPLVGMPKQERLPYKMKRKNFEELVQDIELDSYYNATNVHNCVGKWPKCLQSISA